MGPVTFKPRADAFERGVADAHRTHRTFVAWFYLGKN